MFTLGRAEPEREPFLSARSESGRRCSDCDYAYEDYLNDLMVGIPAECPNCWSEGWGGETRGYVVVLRGQA